MTPRLDTDVCIVGTGASASIAAARLAQSGLRVTMIEQGLPLGDNADFDDVLSRSEPAMVRLDNGAWAPLGYPWTSCNVGGGMVFFGAAGFRLRRNDFDASPYIANAELPVRWPIGYDELMHHYDAIEEVLGISGDEIAADPNHPGGRAPPMPPIAPSPQARRLSEFGRANGLHPFATPLMICSIPYRGRQQCSFCSPCIEHRCASSAKADGFALLVEPLIALSRVELRQGCKAVRFKGGTARRPAALEVIDIATGLRFEQTAHVFVLAANAIQSAAVLLRSADAPFYVNLSDAPVGRGLCMKLNVYAAGYPERPGTPLDEGDPWCNGVGPFSTVACTDYYFSEQCPTGLGGLIYEARYGWRYGVEPSADVARLECLIADTPSWQNRVRLSSAVDQYGVPLVAIDYRAHPRDVARLNWLAAKASGWLSSAGFENIWQEPGGYLLGSSHLHGTCRAGGDPRSSVVDRTGRVHGVENIFVADGGYMPFPGAVNPTLTIQAVASFVAEAVAREFGRAAAPLGSV